MSKKSGQPSLFGQSEGRETKDYCPTADSGEVEKIQEIWRLWLDTHYEGPFGKRPILNHSRWDLLAGALKTYGEQTVRSAIVGCAHSPWHSGQNPTGKKYNDLGMIFRDPKQVQKFVKFHDNHHKDEPDTVNW